MRAKKNIKIYRKEDCAYNILRGRRFHEPKT
jgi:hypothetical protein